MKNISFQAVFALILVLLGALLLLQTTGIYDTTNLIKYIPTLFVLFGIYIIIKSRLQNLSGPIIIILVFGLLQLYLIGLLTTTLIRDWWPLILVAIGLSILLNWFRSPKTKAEDTDIIDLFAMLGGVETMITSKQFMGGSLTAIFGGVKLDLRDSKPKHKYTTINSLVLFGDADIKIPEEWELKINLTPILGDVNDNRMRTQKRIEQKEPKTLEINGLVAFGDIKITD
ncbi:DUF5668 domain-containing protein [Methanonatronarchaeum sp. AMET-Sl]|uniref:LiaF transmembrane domain-containing protein n=1 Tax=Methanonatronarchaeum sp. AMET-Sl TaxID=3037654 RepID=UPI00244DADD3|nr:DUF5668 domain-containing protein [Methanonatronarchaeum sp. AMET-Sl]WGI18050.1 DUF5668 domain-containing protein [Methanonatronarchaeum sp. AMET-Sl]